MANDKTRYVRIIAGELKGRRLVYPSGGAMRPTMDRTREALFSSIQQEVRGAVFVDLFCGAGGVGIEALSRGASRVHFVDESRTALDYLRRNLEACRVPRDRYRIHARDVFHFLARGGLADDAIAVVFADPPYAGGFAGRLLEHFAGSAYDHIGLFVLEHREPLEEGSLGPLEHDRTRRFGDTRLSFWKRPYQPRRHR